MNYFVQQLLLGTVQDWSLLECTGMQTIIAKIFVYYYYFIFLICIFLMLFFGAVYHNLHTCKYKDAKIKVYVC